MNSLVGYGVSSESEEEEEKLSGTEKNEETESKQNTSRNFLVESGSCSSESGSESGGDEEQEEVHAPVSVDSSELPVPVTVSSPSNKLPSPALGGFRVPAGSSVFANPFKERAEQKLSVLQKHVPLTSQAWPTHIAGKRVCVAYRKHGRCRFGIRCKFAHDSDLQQNVPEPTVSDSNSENAVTHTPACTDSGAERDRECEEENQKKKKKHRMGVSDSLIPPKRALKQYAMQRNISHTHM